MLFFFGVNVIQNSSKMSSISNPKSPKTSKDRLAKISSASSVGVEEDEKSDDEIKEVIRKSQQELPGVPTVTVQAQVPNSDNNSLQVSC